MTSSQKALKEATYSLGLIGLALMVGLLIAPRVFAGGPAEDGAGIYKAKCAMCHGPDGSGNTPVGKKMQLRDLCSAEVQKETDSQLAETVAKGKKGMPPYGKSLKEAQIKELVAYLRGLAKAKK